MSVLLSLMLVFCCALLAPALSSCGSSDTGQTQAGNPPSQANATSTLAEARANFKTNLTELWKDNYPADIPPKGVLDIVEYESAVGNLVAYVSPDPGDGNRHPAIVWIAGGFASSIDDAFWTMNDPDNYQSAALFRESGIVTMYPSTRGGNMNPGYQEYFLGEADDIIAAARYLASLPYVDEARIYLGGHSTGGTEVLLVAESSEIFRAVFSFGPAAGVANYGQDQPFDVRDSSELYVRTPFNWLHCVECKTFVIEGGTGSNNKGSLLTMQTASSNPNISFIVVDNHDHFSVLYPGCMVIVKKILADTGSGCNITIEADEIINYTDANMQSVLVLTVELARRVLLPAMIES